MKEIKYKNETLDIERQKKGQLKHNKMVMDNGKILTSEINKRLENHDKDKLNKLEVWARFQIVDRSGIKFGTNEYEELVKSLDVKNALLEHKEKNNHHPEHFGNDFSKMNLVDLIELSADWFTANSTRPSAADFDVMLDYQQKMYHFSDDIKSILKNTFNFLEKNKK